MCDTAVQLEELAIESIAKSSSRCNTCAGIGTVTAGAEYEAYTVCRQCYGKGYTINYPMDCIYCYGLNSNRGTCIYSCSERCRRCCNVDRQDNLSAV